MPRRAEPDPRLPPLPPAYEKRTEQVKIRLSPTEKQRLQRMRPDLGPATIVALIVDDVLDGRYQPSWAATDAPSSATQEPDETTG